MTGTVQYDGRGGWCCYVRVWWFVRVFISLWSWVCMLCGSLNSAKVHLPYSRRLFTPGIQ